MPSTPSTPPITPPTAVPTTAPTGPGIRLPSWKPCAARPGTPCAGAESGAAIIAQNTPANTKARFIIFPLLLERATLRPQYGPQGDDLASVSGRQRRVARSQRV